MRAIFKNKLFSGLTLLPIVVESYWLTKPFIKFRISQFLTLYISFHVLTLKF